MPVENRQSLQRSENFRFSTESRFVLPQGQQRMLEKHKADRCLPDQITTTVQSSQFIGGFPARIRLENVFHFLRSNVFPYRDCHNAARLSTGYSEQQLESPVSTYRGPVHTRHFLVNYVLHIGR